MKLRQAVFVCKDLERNARELCDTLGIEIAYRDPGVGKWGLANVVCPTGHDFLEIVSPTQEGTSAGRYIERRKGDGGYMVILQVPDAVKERERITALGVRAVEKKDLPEYKYTHFHPSDTAGVLLSIDQTVAPAGVDPKLWWPPAAKDWLPHAKSNVTNGLGGVEIQAHDPDAAAALWSKILNRPVEGDIIRLDDDGEIRFVPIADDRGPGVSAFDVKTVDRDPCCRRKASRHGASHTRTARRRSSCAVAASTSYEAAADHRQLPVALCPQGAGVPRAQGHRLRGRPHRAVLRRRPVLRAEPAAAHPGAGRRRPGADAIPR